MTRDDQISEIHRDVKSMLETRLPGIENRLTKIETKHSIWGAIAGFLGGIIAVLLGGPHMGQR